MMKRSVVLLCTMSFGMLAVPSMHLPTQAAAAETAPPRLSPASDSPGLLVDHGKACATIVLPAQANGGEEYAANDLQAVLEKMSGVKLPIVKDDQPSAGNRVLIGNTRFTAAAVSPDERQALGKEGYIVRLRGRDLALSGGGPYGTIYAAAELYDRLGARWYLPGELGEVIPRLETIRFDRLDVRHTPSFAMRWVGKDTAWSLRNRANRISEERLPPAFVVHPGIYHTQPQYVPHREYDATHPEFFALLGGRRSTDSECKLCNSNPLLPAEIARHMAAMLREKPGIDLLSLSPTDGQMWCHCDECRKLDEADVPTDQKYSRRQMVLYNRVAAELQKEFPRQQLLVGAYNVYTWPPKDPALKAHPNLAVVICHYESYCLAHAVNDSACEPNARYLELIRAWQRQTPHVYFYEYYHKGNWIDLPWPIVHTVAADIPFFKSIGIEGLYTQYSEANIWSNFLVHYVAARLLWDHTADVAALLEEFYQKFYAEAAAPMKRYHEALERQVANCGHFPGNAPVFASRVFTEPLLAEVQGYLDEAARMAQTDLVKRRIEKIALSTQYAARLSAYFRLRDRALRLHGPEQKPALAEAIQSVETLRDEVRSERKRYEGIASGSYLSGKLLLAREIETLRAKLDGSGREKPAKKGKGKGEGEG